jgi:hypothetical protein
VMPENEYGPRDLAIAKKCAWTPIVRSDKESQRGNEGCTVPRSE